jgi:MATE family multidrug resistance protein
VSALSVGFGLLTALDTLCSQAHGANRQRQIGLYLQCALIVIGACLLPIFLLNWHSGYLLALVGQDPEVARLAGEFSRITVFGIPFLFIYEMCRKLLQAQNVVKPLAYFAVVGNFINIVGGYVLTYHTSLGFHGAALSRTLGYMALPLCLFVYFAWSRVYEAWWPGWQPRAALKYARLFLRLGVPGFLMMGMEWWAYELMAIFAGNLTDGVVAVSAHAVLMNVASSSYMLFLGISVAGNIRVGNCLGANLPKKARLIAKLTLAMVMAGSTLVGVAVYYLRFQIPKVVINDPVAVARAAQALQIMAVYVVIDATNCVVQGIYRGAGWQHLAARNNVLAYYALGLPLGVLLAFKCTFGIEGLWVGFSAGMVTTLTVCCSILYQTDWEQLAIDARARVAH